MDLTNTTALAGFAAITALWSQIRAIAGRIRALFVIRVTFQGDVAPALTHYLLNQGKVLQWGDRIINSGETHVRPLDRVTTVAYESAPVQPRLIFIHRRPVLLSAPTDGRGTMPDLPHSTHTISLTALRGTVDISQLTLAALDHASALKTSGQRYFVRRIGGRSKDRYDNQISGSTPSYQGEITPNLQFLHWTSADIGAPRPPAPFDSLALCPAGQAARQEFQQWLQLRKWYQARSIPWRRGFLFYGPPGTGKTSLARALAQEADMPIFAFDLSTLTNDEFSHHWTEMQSHTPCMALIEDIDAVFHGRTNIVTQDTHREGLSFDCLLNALSGIQAANGVFVIITTNNPDSLDEALGRMDDTGTSTRPGRLDRTFCLAHPTPQHRATILQRILGTATPDHLQATEGFSNAQTTEYAVQLALAQQWAQPSLVS